MTAGLEHRTASAARAGVPRLVAVLLLVVAFLIVEVAAGLLSGSLALLADAAHLLTDAAGIVLALLAIWFARRPATMEKTYGYHRVEIFAAAVNGLVMLGVAALIVAEALRRIGSPSEVVGPPMVGVAVVGVVVTGASARLLHAGARGSVTLRAAYLEVLGDLLGLTAVIVAGILIMVTGWKPIDAVASILIAALILPRVWSLLRDVADILLQATPRDLDLEEVRAHVRGTPGVADVHDLHAWTLTSGLNVISAHVVLSSDGDPGRVLDELCSCLSSDFDMDHSTLQLERFDRRGLEHAAHP